MPRNPKQDPAVGDVLTNGEYDYRVTRIDLGNVFFQGCKDGIDFGGEAFVSLNFWRLRLGGASVKYVAETK